MKQTSLQQVQPLKTLLERAEAGGYAVGAFSPRYSPMIRAVLRAGQELRSPLIIQISQLELRRYGLTPAAFAAAFVEQMTEVAPTVPVGLHLDHTKELKVIEEAIASGFTSVMIDASEKDLDENIAITRGVVDYAHARGVSVEAELGRIGTTDFVETDTDHTLYTVPAEAARFVQETGVDALAVSVGTAHGVYTQIRQPTIDLDRLMAIRRLTPVHLVLHGGSGVPSELMQAAINLPGGGVSKVNIATDLEIALLSALGYTERTSDAVIRELPRETLEQGVQAVQAVAAEKMRTFLGSAYTIKGDREGRK